MSHDISNETKTTRKQPQETQSAKRRNKSSWQIKLLREAFADNSKPNRSVLRELVNKSGLSYNETVRWFRNERHRAKSQPRTHEQHQQLQDPSAQDAISTSNGTSNLAQTFSASNRAVHTQHSAAQVSEPQQPLVVSTNTATYVTTAFSTESALDANAIKIGDDEEIVPFFGFQIVRKKNPESKVSSA